MDCLPRETAGWFVPLVFHIRQTAHAIAEIKAEAGDLRPEPEVVSTNKYKQIFGIREVHFLSVFALIYVGTEVTIGGMSLPSFI